MSLKDRTEETENPSSPRWKRRPQDRPDEISGAALRIFAQKGFADARMDEIAELAGVSKGTIYLYYESKEDLLIAAVGNRLRDNTEIISRLENDISKTGKHGSVDPKNAIAGILDSFMDILADSENRLTLRIMFSEGQKSEKLAGIRKFFATESYDRLHGVISRSMKNGTGINGRSDEIAVILFGLFMSCVCAEEFLDISFDSLNKKSTRKTITEFMLRGLGLDRDGEADG